MKTMIPCRDRLSASRIRLVLDHPFFGALALRMKFTRETLGRTRTIGTDGRDMFYDKQFVVDCDDGELDFWVAHETLHAAFQHHTRRGKRELRPWNDAGDFAINPILVAAGLTAPQGSLLNPGYAGKSAEQIYELLPQDTEDAEDQGNGSSQGAASASGAGDNKDSDPSGGGANDPNTAGDAPSDQNGLADQPGAVFDAPDPEIQDAEWQIAVKQAAQVAKMMGRLPGDIALAVDQVLRPRVDWRSALRQFVQLRASADFSWSRPNRRYLASGLYLPELRSEALPAIVVIVDTSGSTEDFLPRFKAELQSIVDETQPEAVFVIMADAKVQRVDRFERGEPIEFNVEGLGGTDFRPAFEYIESNALDIACAIYLTDGDGTFPRYPSSFPTLWVITDSSIVAPWGETLHIDTAIA